MTAATVAPDCADTDADTPPGGSASRRRDFTAIGEHVAVVLAVLWWALPMTHRIGGRGPGAVSIGLLALLPALVLVQPWRRLPARWVALALSVPVAAFGVCLLAPTGWYGGNDAAAHAHAVLLALVVAGYARTPARRLALAAAVCLAGLEQFTQAWLPWWGGRSPSSLMSGTFYWHNPFAAFLLAPALLGVSLAVRNRAPWRLAGWVCAPLCAAGIVLSSSRATMACLAVGWLVVGLLLLRGPESGSLLLRWGAVSALSVVALFAVTGPPFFTHRSSPFSSTAQRAGGGQSLQVNGGFRTQFWREATAVAVHHPVSGGGFHSLALASDGLVPSGWARSPLAHNGYLQAWSDGGLLLGLPFLVACLAVASGLLRRVVTAARGKAEGSDVVPVAGVAGLALMAHSAVDFDWSHPALLSMAALLAALSMSGRVSAVGWSGQSSGPTHRWQLAAALACIGVLVVGFAAARSWDATKAALDGRYRFHTPAAQAAALVAAQGPLSDYRLGAAILSVATDPQAPGGSPVPEATLRAAVHATASAAVVDRRLALRRAQALAVLGDRAGASEMTRAVMRSVGASRGAFAADGARALAAAGDLPAARAMLALELRIDLASPGGAPELWTHTAALLQVEGSLDDLSRCAYVAAKRLQPPPPALAITGQPDLTAGVDCDAVLAAAEGAR